MKIKLSGAENQKHLRSDRTRRSLDKSTLYEGNEGTIILKAKAVRI